MKKICLLAICIFLFFNNTIIFADTNEDEIINDKTSFFKYDLPASIDIHKETKTAKAYVLDDLSESFLLITGGPLEEPLNQNDRNALFENMVSSNKLQYEDYSFELDKSNADLLIYHEDFFNNNTFYFASSMIGEDYLFIARVQSLEEIQEDKRNLVQSIVSTARPIELTTGQRNAHFQAEKYIESMPFSYTGLIEQLEFEQYTHDEAIFGADTCGANWSEQAALMAERYLSTRSFSRAGLIDQLVFSGFTQQQAEYGVKQVGY